MSRRACDLCNRLLPPAHADGDVGPPEPRPPGRLAQGRGARLYPLPAAERAQRLLVLASVQPLQGDRRPARLRRRTA